MRYRAGVAAVAAGAALGIAPVAAEAVSFCVSKPKCVKAGGTAQPNVQAALNAAAANGPARDRVELGANTFADGPFTAGVGNPVNVVGRGTGKTTLSRTDTTNGVVILDLDDPGSRAADLRVRVNDGTTTYGIRTPGTVERVNVAGQSSDIGQAGVVLDQGGRLIGGRVTMPTSTSSYGVILNGPSTVARSSRIRGGTGMLASAFSSQSARAVRVAIVARELGFGVTSGDVILDQATIRMLGSPPFDAVALMLNPASGDSSLIANHVTAVGTGAANTAGVRASVLGIGPCPTAKLLLHNSILRRFATDLERSATGGCLPGDVEASIDIAWSVYSAAKVVESGNGEIRRRKGNRNVNPRFRSQARGDYRLRRRSPLIDRGQKGKPKKGESKVDLAGRRRVLDGDGNGKARRDIGAFERKAKRRR